MSVHTLKGSWTEKLKFPWSFDIYEVIVILKHTVSFRTQNFLIANDKDGSVDNKMLWSANL